MSSFSSYLFYFVTLCLDSPDSIIENDTCQVLCVVLEFFVRDLGCFLWPILPKVSKITDLPKVSQNKQVFDLAKVRKMTINFELLEINKMTSLKIYISPVMEKLETSDLDSR